MGDNMTENEFFAKRLSELRRAAKLTQGELAKTLNISRSCLANYESCRRYPSFGILQSVAEYFDVSVNYLVGKEDFDKSREKVKRLEYELSRILTEKSNLDISGVSPAAKIALIEFYQYLSEKSENKAVNKEK